MPRILLVEFILVLLKNTNPLFETAIFHLDLHLPIYGTYTLYMPSTNLNFKGFNILRYPKAEGSTAP